MKIIVISGTTASGKSALALDIALQYNGVVINADSMQIYQEIPIITAQPLEEMKLAPHLLYGDLSVTQTCSVGLYLELVQKTIKDTIEQGKLPILVGGTGLYLKSLIYGIAPIIEIDPEIRIFTRDLYLEIGPKKFYQLLISLDPASAKLNMLDKQRVMRAYEVFKQTSNSISSFQENKEYEAIIPEGDYLQIGLIPERTGLYQKINHRFTQMIEHGVIEEIKQLNMLTMDENLPARRAHGVRELTAYLLEQISLEEAIAKSQQITRNYAKRQLTWISHQMPEMTKLFYHDISEVVPHCHQLIREHLDR